MLAAFAFSVCLALVRANPVGTYAPDFSHAVAKTRGAAIGYFRGNLHISPNGTFSMPGNTMEGFWRRVGNKLVLNYSGFFQMPRMDPDEVIKASWPKSNIEGHVLKIRSDGTLVLADFGACKGPFYFQRAPRRSTASLVPLSMGSDDAASIEAFTILKDEGAQRWRELIDYVQDPRNKPSDRGWAALAFGPTPDSGSPRVSEPNLGSEARHAVLRLIGTLNTTGFSASEAGRVRRNLFSEVAAFGDPSLLPRLLQIGTKFGFSGAYMAQGIAAANYLPGVPLIEGLLKSSKAGERSKACDALAKMGVTGSLPTMRPLALDANQGVRIAANGAILRLSPDATEQAACVKRLVAEESPLEYTNSFIIDALGASRSKLAVSPLIEFLTDGKAEFDRREAAEKLGVLGFREALGPLRSAAASKAQKVDQHLTPEQGAQLLESAIATMANDRWVRKNAIEAIWKIEHPKSQ